MGGMKRDCTRLQMHAERQFSWEYIRVLQATIVIFSLNIYCSYWLHRCLCIAHHIFADRGILQAPRLISFGMIEQFVNQQPWHFYLQVAEIVNQYRICVGHGWYYT